MLHYASSRFDVLNENWSRCGRRIVVVVESEVRPTLRRKSRKGLM